MGKVKVKIAESFILKLLHLSLENIICDAKFVGDYLELTFANPNIPEGLHDGYIQSDFNTSELVLQK